MRRNKGLWLLGGGVVALWLIDQQRKRTAEEILRQAREDLKPLEKPIVNG